MGSANGAKRDLSVGIVGAGFGGVGIAIKLREAGFDRLRRSSSAATASAASGARTPTRAPPATCPRTSTRYSFAPGHHWSRRYAPQAEILAYLERGRRATTGSPPTCGFGTEVTGAEFDAESGRWTVRTDDGAEHGFDVLVTACGQLTRPAIPPLAGDRELRGPVLPLGRVGPRRRSRRPHRGGDRDGRERDPARPRDREGRRADHHLPALRALDPPPKTDRAYPDWERALFRRFPAARRGGPDGQLRVLRAARARAHGRARSLLSAVRTMAEPRTPPGAARRPRPARRGHPGLRDRLQARARARATGIRPCSATTSSWSPARSPA